MQKYTIKTRTLAAVAPFMYVDRTTIYKALTSRTPKPKHYSDRHNYQRPSIACSHVGVLKQIRLCQIHLNCFTFSSQRQNVVYLVVNLHLCFKINSRKRSVE
jgi:hypothetical protein